MINKPKKDRRAHIIVFGNEKGGSGKSTAAMHTAIGLLRLGYKVATVDLDSHQATLTSYFRNRWHHIEKTGEKLPSPEHILIDRDEENTDIIKSHEEEEWRVRQVINELSKHNDFIVIDTPGSNAFMSIVGHSYADTLVTPLNDSFVDLDLLARLDPETHAFEKASVYAQMVEDQRRLKQSRDGGEIRWVVMRNRLSHSEAMNKRHMTQVLEDLAPRLGFEIAPGFGERVIFRELFLQGLTLLDIREGGRNILSMSNLTARQEVRHLVKKILPEKSVTTLALLKTG